MAKAKKTPTPRCKKMWRFLKKDIWVNGVLFGVDGKGQPIHYTIPGMVKYSIIGALFICYPAMTKRLEVREKIERELARQGFDCSIGVWEDMKHRQWSHVHTLLKCLGV